MQFRALEFSGALKKVYGLDLSRLWRDKFGSFYGNGKKNGLPLEDSC